MRDRFSDINSFLRLIEDTNLEFPTYPRLPGGINSYTMPDGLGVYIRGTGVEFAYRGNSAEIAFSYICENFDGSVELVDILRTIDDNVLFRNLCFILWDLYSRNLLLNGTDKLEKYSKCISPRLLQHAQAWEQYISYSDLKSSLQLLERAATKRIFVIYNGLTGGMLVDNLIRSGFCNISTMNLDRHSLAPVFQEQVRKINLDLSASAVYQNTVEQALMSELEGNDILVVTGAGWKEEFVFEISKIAKLLNVPILVCNLKAENYELGPYYDLANSSCLKCAEMTHRSFNNLSMESELYERYLAGDFVAENVSVSEICYQNTYETFTGSAIAAAYTSKECEAILLGSQEPETLNNQIRLNPISGKSEEFAVGRIQGCEVCGVSTTLEEITYRQL